MDYISKKGHGGKDTAWDAFVKKASLTYGTVYITRDQAISANLKLYYSTPCKNGHDTHRHVVNRCCLLCQKSAPFKEVNIVQIDQGKVRCKLEEKLELLALDKEWYY